MNDVKAIRDAIRRLHGCESAHVESVPISERFQGRTVWEGTVEVFNLTGHSKATRCYAWQHEQGAEGSRFVAVLELPPVNSARKAVQVAVAAEARSKA
ncbi:MAG TPA: hypothetical protein VGJ05_09520 [Fimbriiglobus sp.]|jgi:hypothetical protein